MAETKQRRARTKSASVIKWTPEMEQRLFLAVLRSCEVNISNGKIASMLGGSASAIGQHMVKLRREANEAFTADLKPVDNDSANVQATPKKSTKGSARAPNTPPPTPATPDFHAVNTSPAVSKGSPVGSSVLSGRISKKGKPQTGKAGDAVRSSGIDEQAVKPFIKGSPTDPWYDESIDKEEIVA